ncbi:heat shock protein HtpX [Desmospora sp. 8437]|nr:heat shock protein HtpX [Desmospora sp. 8437]
MRVTEGGLGFTWSDFGSSEQRKRHVKPNPDRLGPEIYQTHPSPYL